MSKYERGKLRIKCICGYNLTQRVGVWSCDLKQCKNYSIPFTRDQLKENK